MVQVKLDDVEVPEELLQILGRSRLAARDRAGQIRAALAVHLFLAGEVSLGKAAELTGESRSGFERLLDELGLPSVQYDGQEYQRDLKSVETLEKRHDAD